MKYCTTSNASPSKKPTPTRNAYVPVPPARPVVSVSMNRSRVAAAGESPRPSRTRLASAAESAPPRAVSPWQWVSAKRRRTQRTGPSAVSSTAPPSASSSDAGARGAGGS